MARHIDPNTGKLLPVGWMQALATYFGTSRQLIWQIVNIIKRNCPECGKEFDGTEHRKCDSCRAAAKKRYWDKRKERKRVNGECTYCDRPALPGLKVCGLHRERFARNGKKRRDYAIENGLCSRCYKKKPVEGMKMCATCREAVNAYQRDLRSKKREKQVREPVECSVEIG